MKYLYFNFHRLKFTSNSNPDDEVAIQIGQLFLNNQEQAQIEFKEKLKQIKEKEKEKDFQGKFKVFN